MAQKLGAPRESFWRGKRVLVTGHAGFKGSWLTLWLVKLGAEVTGLSLPEDFEPSPNCCAVKPDVASFYADIRDYDRVLEAMRLSRPEIVLHLAAQPLVRLSYKEPLFTFGANVMGTAHVLEAAREIGGVRSIVVITTDKCYEDQRWLWPYRENDRLGGHDPYSSSKACAELVSAAYRASYFGEENAPAVATARAGNVIGGGDWSVDRLVPDIVRAFLSKEPVHIRRPDAVRPWQHVLEPLGGYLHLAEYLWNDKNFAEEWNFGPSNGEARSVAWMMRHFAEAWGTDPVWTVDKGPHPHETELLQLDCSKARRRLGWESMLSARDALRMTADWYRRNAEGEGAIALAEEQLATYIIQLEECRI